MKTKSLIIGAAATMFAIGGATASNMLIIGKYVQKSPRCCAIQPIECGVAGPNLCSAVISGVTYAVYQSRSSANVCTMPLTSTHTAPLPTDCID